VPVAEPDAGAAPERAAADTALWARVRELPDKQRLAVAYRFVADLAYREIGEAMGTSEEAARRNVFEGLRALRAQEALTATR
jgi:DNA-directed RNA polymerase specialized sigma24 family protein